MFTLIIKTLFCKIENKSKNLQKPIKNVFEIKFSCATVVSALYSNKTYIFILGHVQVFVRHVVWYWIFFNYMLIKKNKFKFTV